MSTRQSRTTDGEGGLGNSRSDRYGVEIMVDGRHAELALQQFAIPIDRVDVAFNEMEAARGAGRLVIDGRISSAQRGRLTQHLVARECLPPDERYRGLRIERDQFEAGTDVVLRAADGRFLRGPAAEASPHPCGGAVQCFANGESWIGRFRQLLKQ